MPTPIPVPWGLELLRKLHRAGATGTFSLSDDVRGTLTVYLMDGQIIGCGGPADLWNLGRMLVCSRAVDAEAMQTALTDAGDGLTFADLLLERQALSHETFQEVQAERFRDAVYSVAGYPEGKGTFEEDDTVFPPEIQLGVATDLLLEEAISWFHRVGPLLGRYHGGEDPPFRARLDRGVVGPRAGAALLALLADGPKPLSDLLAQSPMSGSRTLEALSILLADQLVLEGDLPPEPAGALPEDLPPEPAGALPEDLPPALMEPLTPSQGPAASNGPAPPNTIDVDAVAVDYEQVSKGRFVQTYEVRDVVDLTGIEPLGVGHGEPLVVEVDGADADLGDGDMTEDHLAELDNQFYETTDSLPEVTELDHVLSLPVTQARHPSGDEQTEEYQIDEEDPAATPPVVRSLDEDPPIDGEAGAPPRFEALQLQDFYERIDIFNRIFQIIFRTYSVRLGPDRTLERFDRFLTDETLQYPTLFQRVRARDDGSLSPAALVANLAQSPPGDPAAILHQGLYELIYVHLYDAKDLLPPDVERDMMDQIDAFEQRLHSR